MSSSVSAEEAVRRAKEIAARLAGGGNTNNDEGATGAAGSGKRKRWGVMPGDDDGDASKQAKKTTIEPVQKRVWIKVSEERPAWHYVSYLTRAFASMVDERSNDTDASLTLELHGKGSPKQSLIPGMPLEPLHVQIGAAPQIITDIENQVYDLVDAAQNAQLEPQENNTDLQLISQEDALQSNTTYKPASVTQLIANGHYAARDPHATWQEVVVQVPHGTVGFIIGRGGENITRMQNNTGCKIQIQKEHEVEPGQSHRNIAIQGHNPAAIEECRSEIVAMVDERVASLQGSSSGVSTRDAKVHEAIQAGHVHVEVLVPDTEVGLIIGKAGAQIRQIQEASGANVQVPPPTENDANNMRHVHVTCPTEQGAQYAKNMIESLLASKAAANTNVGAQQYGSSTAAPQVTIYVNIPDTDVGLCIGRQGSVVKYMQDVTRCRIQIPSQSNPGETTRVATISGPQDGCNRAKELIEQIIAEQSSYGVMNGRPRQDHQQQQNRYQQQPADNGAYSAEWAAYYAMQAAAQQQQGDGTSHQPTNEMPQQQQHQQQATAPATAASSSSEHQQQSAGSDQYHEQFFRYAYYYGEDAARQHYGAWSPPVGTSNPYGVNPNGITAPPAASAPAAVAPASSAPAPSSAPAAAAPIAVDATETSRRKVSNLPAWMTNIK